MKDLPLAAKLPYLTAELYRVRSMGIAETTRANYDGPQRRFLQFCRHDCKVDPFAATLATLHAVVQLWCVRLARTCKVESIEKYLSAVNRLYTERGMSTPTYRDRWLKDTLNGLRRERFARYGAPTVSRKLPLTPVILLKLRARLSESYEDRLLWGMLCTGFFGFLRCAEMTTRPRAPKRATLLQSHWTTKSGGVELYIPYSKGDQYGHGVRLQLGVSGHPLLCPVRAMAALQAHPSYPRGCNQPLFPLPATGRACTRSWFTARLSGLLKAAGLDSSTYSGHSLRRVQPRRPHRRVCQCLLSWRTAGGAQWHSARTWSSPNHCFKHSPPRSSPLWQQRSCLQLHSRHSERRSSHSSV